MERGGWRGEGEGNTSDSPSIPSPPPHEIKCVRLNLNHLKKKKVMSHMDMMLMG